MNIILSVLCIALSGKILASSVLNHSHLPPDLSFQESRILYKNLKAELSHTKSINSEEEIDSYVQKAIDAGEKMNSWLNLVNSVRAEESKLRLTSKTTQVGYPVDKPSEYGPSTVKKNYKNLDAKLPVKLKKVFLGDGKISESIPVGDEEFIKWAKAISRNYQSAVRWTGMKRFLNYYTKRRVKDVRGFYYLKNLTDLNNRLMKASSLPEDEQKTLRTALKDICVNAGQSRSYCENSEAYNYKKDSLLKFKNRYWSKAQDNWNSFFIISKPRTDVVWKKSHEGVMKVIFKDPKKAEIAVWLKDNIEDEFKIPSKPWEMEFHFVRGGFGTAYLEFKKNVTPHVSGGNKIVMDANTDIQEYGVRWTIRHEFGHILRLPDCYFEFYDSTRKLMVNYQLDVDDLMCSRKGRMNERIYEELKRVYLK